MEERDDWHLTETIGHERGRGDPFAAAIRGTRMAMVITDPRQVDNPIVFANQAFQDLTGYERREIIGRNCRFLQGPDTSASSLQRIRDALAAVEPINIDLLNYRKDGTRFWNALYISPVKGEDGSVQFFFASQLEVSDRIQAQHAVSEQKALVEEEIRLRTAALEAALEAKTILLHEVDHRVKNNLTMIGSLLRLQSRAAANPLVRTTLENMLERVDALSSVHRRLYQTDDLSRFDVGAFAESLAADVIGASGRDDIRLTADVEPVEIPASRAAAIGLILNELVTNAVKHGFADGRAGEMSLAVRRNNGTATIEIADDGPGFDPDAPCRDSIGRLLVDRLSRQVQAETRWDAVAPGTRVSLTLPVGR